MGSIGRYLRARRGKSHKSLYYGPKTATRLGICPQRPAHRGSTAGPTSRGVHSTPPPAVHAVLKERGLTEKHEPAVGLLEEPAEARFMEVEELRNLAVEGRERGILTFEEIAACLEEVEVTKEQIADFRAHLLEAGVEIVSA